MNKVLIATSNQGKIKELKRILNEYTTNNHIDLTILTLNDFPKISEPIEMVQHLKKMPLSKQSIILMPLNYQ